VNKIRITTYDINIFCVHAGYAFIFRPIRMRLKISVTASYSNTVLFEIMVQ